MNPDRLAESTSQKNSAPHEVKILLVDDRIENLISLESILKKEGENIAYIFAESGEEALKIALREELALILLDVQMPVMNGYEVARFLRDISKTRDIPIIFVTAIDEKTSHMVEGFEAGAVDFLFKPLHPTIVKAKVSAFVRFYRQKKELEKANQYALQLNRELEDRVKERTKELTRINNDLDNFIYTASHDLKAPINNIEGLLMLLYRHMSKEMELSQNVLGIKQRIDESISRFKKTILDLTEIAKVQNESSADNVSVSFKEMLEEIKIDIKDLIERSDAVIEDNFDKAPEASFSRKNMRSIIYNLVSNAVKFNSPDRNPEIRISSYREGKYVVLEVCDNGLGLRKEDQHKVFGMFKRLHNHVEGTGVGMAIVKKIIENNDGKITVESELDKGCTFKVYFKAAELA